MHGRVSTALCDQFCLDRAPVGASRASYRGEVSTGGCPPGRRRWTAAEHPAQQARVLRRAVAVLTARLA